MHDWNGTWYFFGMWHWWLLILILLGVGGWFGVSRTRSDGDAEDEDSPEKIVKRRYAAGEIDSDTYAKMLKELRDPPR